jgi:uncharacterized protein with FMN-binding domain
MRVLLTVFLVILLIGCTPVEQAPEQTTDEPEGEETGPDPELLAEIERVHDTMVNDVDLTTIEDGVYEGSFGYYGVDYGVKVTVKDHKIESIEVTETEEEDEYAKKAEAVLDRVIDEQRTTVDATTGATTTSIAFLKAVELALTQG